MPPLPPISWAAATWSAVVAPIPVLWTSLVVAVLVQDASGDASLWPVLGSTALAAIALGVVLTRLQWSAGRGLGVGLVAGAGVCLLWSTYFLVAT